MLVARMVAVAVREGSVKASRRHASATSAYFPAPGSVHGPLTVAVNRFKPPGETVVLAGDTEAETGVASR